MISVCLATYNGEKYLREQLDSILCQLSESDEIIISDDGSSDSTLEIIQQYNDYRIQFYNHDAPHGVIHNFENALRHASGDYIFLSDQDDVWESNKVELCIKLLQDNICVVHNAKIIDGNGIVKHKSFFSLRKSKSGYWNNIWRNSYLGCCMCFKRELLDHLLPIPKNVEMHDRWVGLIAQMYGNVSFEEKCLIGYRVHGNNVSNSTGKSKNSIWQMFVIRFWLLFYTIRRYLKLG